MYCLSIIHVQLDDALQYINCYSKHFDHSHKTERVELFVHTIASVRRQSQPNCVSICCVELVYRYYYIIIIIIHYYWEKRGRNIKPLIWATVSGGVNGHAVPIVELIIIF